MRNLNSIFLSSVKTEWESGISSGDCLLQAVCRCSLAALLKHSGLQNEACWQDRSESQDHDYLNVYLDIWFWNAEKDTYYCND